MEKTVTIAEKVRFITKEIQEQYLEDDSPWIIGYFGGKDSTMVLQIINSCVGLLAQELNN